MFVDERILDFLEEVKADPAVIYAFRKTGMLLEEANEQPGGAVRQSAQALVELAVCRRYGPFPGTIYCLGASIPAFRLSRPCPIPTG